MQKEWIAHLSLAFVAFIWGTTFVVVQNAISLVEPFTFNAVRFLLAGLLLLITQLRYKQSYTATSVTKDSIVVGMCIGFFLFGGYLLQTFGLLYTSSSKAGFITGLSIVLVPIFSYFFFKQKTTRLAIIGVGTATVGLFLLTADNSFTFNKGDLLVLGCAVSFAVHILINGKYSAVISPLVLSTIQVLTVGVLSAICAVLFEDWERVLSPSLWQNGSFLFALFLTAVFATALAFFIQTAAQKHVSPTRVALLLALEPVFAALTGVIVAHEALPFTSILGCAGILLGMILSELPDQPKKKHAQAA